MPVSSKPNSRDVLVCAHVVTPTTSVAGYARSKGTIKVSDLKAQVSGFLADHLKTTVGELEAQKMGSKDSIIVIHENSGVLSSKENLPKDGRVIALSPTSVQPGSFLSDLPLVA
ncbi:hypothetical protein H0H87_001250, partial [Tephrocybe sp. NHM501043]